MRRKVFRILAGLIGGAALFIIIVNPEEDPISELVVHVPIAVVFVLYAMFGESRTVYRLLSFRGNKKDSTAIDVWLDRREENKMSWMSKRDDKFAEAAADDSKRQTVIAALRQKRFNDWGSVLIWVAIAVAMVLLKSNERNAFLWLILAAMFWVRGLNHSAELRLLKVIDLMQKGSTDKNS